ncbi:MAG: F0F1 ATP synthase subunit epsilon [Desulfovibrio sp.]|nr:F0F1 ATP synthase subunit epsilon [Desulfovibrio sp.]
MATFQLQVVTPDKTVVNEEVETAICPGLMGEFGVMPNHAPMIAALKIGKLVYRIDGKDRILFISGGFVDIRKNKCAILAESAETAEQIDQDRAEAARKRAQERLEKQNGDIDQARAQIALQKAMMRLHIANLRVN